VAAIPAYLTPHTVTIRPLTGSGGLGDVFGTAVPNVPALVVEGAQLVRATDASEVVSSARVTVHWDQVAPPGSQVTVWVGTGKERTSTVITTEGAPHPSLPSFLTMALV
jgi:hypothetical protein